MNTFISLIRETNASDLLQTMDLIRRVERISLRVTDVWSECLAARNDIGRLKAHDNLNALREIMLVKLDAATVRLLQFSDEGLDNRQEMNIEETAHKLSLGMWASYADVRPIRKSVHFESMGIQLDLQKQLLQQHDNFVFRMIRMPIVGCNLDAYNLPPALAADLSSAGGNGGNGGMSGMGEEKDGGTSRPSKYVVGDLVMFDILVAPAAAFHLRVRKWTMRDKSVASTKLRKTAYPSSVPSRMQLKVPKEVVITDDMRIAVWNEEHQDWTEDGISDYQYSEANRTVHFYITTVGFLALVKSRTVDMPLKKWSLVPVVHKPVNALLARRLNLPNAEEFEADLVANVEGGSVDSVEGSGGDDGSVRSPNTKPGPEDKVDFVALAKTDPVTQALSLSAEDSLERYARLTVQTQMHEVVIDVVGARCRLVKPNTPVFADILGVPMHPGSLLFRLQTKGINLLPNESDLLSTPHMTPKESVLESQLLREVARGSSSMEFASSPWNQTLNDSQAGILIRESNVYTAFTQNNEYECLFVEMDAVSMSYNNTPDLGPSPGPGGLKYTLVYGNEYGDKKSFSHVPRPGEISHLDVPRALVSRATLEALGRLKAVNQSYNKTVFTLLSLIRPYSLC
jgi:hypothetical protein